MLWVLKPARAGHTVQSSPCSSNLPPFMPSAPYCSLGRGVPEAGLLIFSYRSSPRIRFVLVLIFLMRQNLEIKLPNHDVKQVIAPYLIVLRVANQSALTSKAVASGNIGSMHFKSRGESTTGGIETIPDVYPTDSESDGKTPTDLRVGVETAIDFHCDKV
jgi:hypothetical protein